jgi:hypothetical protein
MKSFPSYLEIKDLDKMSKSIKEMKSFLSEFSKKNNPQNENEDYPFDKNSYPLKQLLH